MNVKLEIAAQYQPPYAVIYTNAVTDEVKRAMDYFSAADSAVIAQKGERMQILNPREIFMVRVEDGETVIYTEKDRLYSRKRLYELLSQLGTGFMQISKACAVNLSFLDSVESSFGATLLLKLKNGLSDFVSRTYLPGFKKYLGL